MLYSEFVEGTGCRETDYNIKVYKDLEIMYMNSDLTKQEIYEYGKKLVDNSKTENETTLENEIKNEIKELREEIRNLKTGIEYRENYINTCGKDDTDSCIVDDMKRVIKSYKQQIKESRNRISALKWCLE